MILLSLFKHELNLITWRALGPLIVNVLINLKVRSFFFPCGILMETSVTWLASQRRDSAASFSLRVLNMDQVLEVPERMAACVLSENCCVHDCESCVCESFAYTCPSPSASCLTQSSPSVRQKTYTPSRKLNNTPTPLVMCRTVRFWYL